MAQDPYRYFRPEARELVDQFAKGVLELEKGEGTSEVVHKLLRVAHTLKGAARVVRQTEIANLAHAIEDTLSPWRDDQHAAIERAQIDCVLEHIDGISSRVDLLAPITGAQSRSESAENVRTVRTEVAEIDSVLDGVSETHALLNGGAPVDQIDRELRQLREAAERLRLAPAESLFTALERTARDVALASGKKVEFSSEGGEIRLDTSVLEAMQSALIQFVRNAVAHGIEPETERRAAGKPPAGRIAVHVSRRGRQIAFVCSDDGRGVDLDAVRRAAQQRGLLGSAGNAGTADELMQMLLHGGISTAKAVTDVAGRGVGLDVVREAARQLGGRVSFESRRGAGARFEILIPPSLAAMDVLFVEAEDSTGAIAIPLDAVRKTLRVSAADISRASSSASLLFESAAIPYAPLAKLITGTEPIVPAHFTVVVVQSANGAGSAALGVARLREATTVVVRPLPAAMTAEAVVAGVTLDAEGNPQLVLDPDGLIGAICRGYAATPAVKAPKRPILVVDDSMTTRMLEKSILESAGFEVDVATSGEEGFDCLRAKPPALILVDVEMPGMDGFTFVERLRADRGLRDIPAILVTSRVSPDDLRRGRDVGANGHIAKSEFDQARLLAMIDQLTGV